MSLLQICWIAVAICTIVFLVVAAVSALPKMKAPYTAAVAAIFLAASGITAFGSIAPILSAVGLAPPVVTYKLPPTPYPAAPLANNASAGKVVFTFDDGPDVSTGLVIAELNALHVRGVFFVRGDKAAAHPEIIRALVANGEVVGNHTWDHPSMTGKGTGTQPLSQAQVRTELARADDAIVAAGAPGPALWRPPYGAVNLADEKTAQTLGLRVVLDSGTNIIDSNDWAGLTAQQIAARVEPHLKNGTIIAFHDGLRQAPQMVKALPLIVAYMNAHHLGATTAVRADATGGVVPYLGPSPAKHAPAASAPVTPPAARAAATAPPASSPVRFPPPSDPASASPASTPAHTSRAPAPPSTPAPAPPSTPPPSTPAPPPTTPAPSPSPTTPAPADAAPANPAPASTIPPPAPSGG